jgi:PKD repeat protein
MLPQRRMLSSLAFLAIFSLSIDSVYGATVQTRTISVGSLPAALPNPAAINEPVAFAVAASDSDNAALSFAWDFGDGSAGSGESPVHVYSAAGTYAVAVTISNGTTSSVEALVVNVAGSPDAGDAASYQIQLLLLEMENLRESLVAAGAKVIGNDIPNAGVFMNDAAAIAQRLGADAANPATAALFEKKAKSVQTAFAKLTSSVDAAKQKIADSSAASQTPAKELKPVRTALGQLARIDALIARSELIKGGVITTKSGFQKAGDTVKVRVSLAATAKNATLVLTTAGAAGANIATAVLPESITSGNYSVTMGPDAGVASLVLYVDGKRWGGVVLNNSGTAASGPSGDPKKFDGTYTFVATVNQSDQSFPFGFKINGTATVTNGRFTLNSSSLPSITTTIGGDGSVSFRGTNLTNDRINFRGTFTPAGANLPAGVHNGIFDGVGHGNYTGTVTNPGSFGGTWTALKVSTANP